MIRFVARRKALEALVKAQMSLQPGMALQPSKRNPAVDRWQQTTPDAAKPRSVRFIVRPKALTTEKVPFPHNMLEFQQLFNTEEACAEYLFHSRWPKGFACPKCQKREHYWLPNYGLAECKSCGHQTSVTAGTVMHKTRTPLTKWFLGAFLVTTHTPGFSALQFQKYAGIKTYETAFQMLHKLRAGLVRPEADKIHGVVEVDETYIGGPHEGKRGRGAEGKVIVAGAVEVLDEGSKKTEKRVGRLRLSVIPNVTSDSLCGFIKDVVEPESIIITDDLSSYERIAGEGYAHAVSESKEMEHIHHVFGNLKTWLEGTHHGVSEKHIQAYLNEYVFRFNRRRSPMAAFQTALGLGSHTMPPTYAQLYDAGEPGGWVHPNPLHKEDAHGQGQNAAPG